MKEILSTGVKAGHNMARAARYGDKLPGTLYYDNRQWHNVLNVRAVVFKQDSYMDIDARMGMFKIACSLSAAMVMDIVEKGSKYPYAYKDAVPGSTDCLTGMSEVACLTFAGGLCRSGVDRLSSLLTSVTTDIRSTRNGKYPT